MTSFQGEVNSHVLYKKTLFGVFFGVFSIWCSLLPHYIMDKGSDRSTTHTHTHTHTHTLTHTHSPISMALSKALRSSCCGFGFGGSCATAGGGADKGLWPGKPGSGGAGGPPAGAAGMVGGGGAGGALDSGGGGGAGACRATGENKVCYRHFRHLRDVTFARQLLIGSGGSCESHV